LKKIIKKIFFNNIGLTCNFAELIDILIAINPPKLIGSKVWPKEAKEIVFGGRFRYHDGWMSR